MLLLRVECRNIGGIAGGRHVGDVEEDDVVLGMLASASSPAICPVVV